MASLYTYEVANGSNTDFPTFALRCASSDHDPTELRGRSLEDMLEDRRVADTSNLRERLEKDTAELQTVLGWDDETATQAAHQAYLGELATQAEIVRSRAQKKDRYKAMLGQVGTWDPPTDGHGWLKELMVKQLRSSIGHDTGASSMPEPVEMAGSEYRDHRISSLARSIASGAESIQDEENKATERNDWLHTLVRSLIGWQTQ